jgi:hypothetical protein
MAIHLVRAMGKTIFPFFICRNIFHGYFPFGFFTSCHGKFSMEIVEEYNLYYIYCLFCVILFG